MTQDYLKLKSGTDVRGVASDLFGKPVDLTDEAVEDIAASFASWLAHRTGKPTEALSLALGHDSRISADRISGACKRALLAAGLQIFDCGLASTPAMFLATLRLKTDGAIQITASHHPADRNGLKFFTPSGGLEGEDIAAILSGAMQIKIAREAGEPESGRVAPGAKGKVAPVAFMDTYAKILRDMICGDLGRLAEEAPLSGLHIVVDAGNGAGGFYATQVLEPLGADISGSQFLEPDGLFPNHIPNPENETAMQSIQAAVKAARADLGIIFDTDVDRAGCVDASGEEINRNRLVALASAIALRGNPGGTIVTDSVTSDGLKVFIEQTLGGVHYRYRRGYKNVINKALELTKQGVNCPLAIETSGHAAFRENYFLDDGAYLVTKIVTELARGNRPGQIIAALQDPAEAAEFRFAIKAEDFRACGEGVLGRLEAFAERQSDMKIADDNREGLRVSVPGGWFLLRLSVHDPILPLNIESDLPGGVEAIVQRLKPFFAAEPQIDASILEQ